MVFLKSLWIMNIFIMYCTNYLIYQMCMVDIYSVLIIILQGADNTIFFLNIGETYEPIGFIETPSSVKQIQWSPSKFVSCHFNILIWISCLNLDVTFYYWYQIVYRQMMNKTGGSCFYLSEKIHPSCILWRWTCLRDRLTRWCHIWYI